MRRLLALLLLLPGALVLAGMAAPPAQAGGNTPVEVHGLAPSSWGLRSYDCAGVPDDGTTYRLEATDLRLAGSGSLRVTTAAGSVGGALFSSAKYLRSLSYSVYVVRGTDPHTRWHVEIGNHVLESDPIPIAVDAWTTLALLDSTLHEGDWSGTIDDWIAEHGWPNRWTAGILTGGCLGSPRVQIDKPRTRGYVYNLEPSDWTRLTLTVPDDVLSSWYPVYGHSFELATRVRHTDLETGETTTVPGARVELFQRYSHQPWTSVTTARADDTGNLTFTRRALRSADYYVRIGNAARRGSFPEVEVPAHLALSRPQVNGKSGDRLTLSGRLAPAGEVLAVFKINQSTDSQRRTKTVSIDERGRWSVSFHVRSGVSYYWSVTGTPTSRRYARSAGYEGIFHAH